MRLSPIAVSLALLWWGGAAHSSPDAAPAGQAPATTTAAPPRPLSEIPNHWRVEDRTSQLDGAQTFSATIDADGTVTGITGRQEPPTLSILCDSHGLMLMVTWPDFVELHYNNHFTTVTWKVGSGPVQHDDWFAGTQSAALVGPSALTVIRQLTFDPRLMLRIQDQHGGQEATFSVDHISEVVTRLTGRRCG